MTKLIVLRRYVDEPEAGFILRLRTTIDYAAPGTRFAVISQDTLRKVRAAGITIPLHVLEFSA
jgi:hypothetical protein